MYPSTMARQRLVRRHSLLGMLLFLQALLGIRIHKATCFPTGFIARKPNLLPRTTFHRGHRAVPTSLSSSPQRQVHRTERFARLPVWPAWNGVLLFLLGRITSQDVAARMEHRLTGRVCPNFFQYPQTSPFILLVHHCHSFWALDPLRWLQRLVFPEGFPSHPHRGFVTLTYIIEGGFVHRDSCGVRQTYSTQQAQWLHTGAGVLHEEMFHQTPAANNSHHHNHNPLLPQRQELFQLWINVPAKYKMDSPQTVLLPELPVVDGTTRVLAGSYRNLTSTAPIHTPMSILHVTLPPNAVWEWEDTTNTMETVIIYVRTGSLIAPDVVPTHTTAYFTPRGPCRLQASDIEGCDFMFLAGQPIQEPCASQGSMVMNTHDEINSAYADYQAGYFGRPWKESLSDDEWKQHVRQYPSKYAAPSFRQD